jgi:hypothetical protein
MVMHTTDNRQDDANFIFLQYWLFYDASMSAVGAIAGDPYHEGDVEFVQAAIMLDVPAWSAGTQYPVGRIVRYQDASGVNYYTAMQAHTATSENAPPNTAFWQKPNWQKPNEYKIGWFLPFSATAAQHYYGQTVRWNLTNGAAAASPQQQTWVQHEKNGRFRIFVAEGTHATYFAAGDFDVSSNTADQRLGTEIQYQPVGVADFIYETAGDTQVEVDVWQYPASDFEQWLGRWGYK